MKKDVYIGTSGWSYQHWRDNFYPEKLSTKEWLSFYGEAFPSVEVNTTFYHTPLKTTVQNWYATVPEDFIFSVKASRYLTHLKRLKECEQSLDFFYKSIQGLKEKTGPLLFQLPPFFKCDPERLAEFISHFKKGYQHVFEFRHSSWFTDEIYELLSKKGIALCITDLNGYLSPEEITADFTYIRLHGPKKAYQGSYSPAQLRSWRKKIEKWNVSVYCYFDNDEKGYAIQDAKSLKDLF